MSTVREEVYLLGCGRSVAALTEQERTRINQAACRLALNKFAAFHDVARIRPTHIWFTEYHSRSDRVLQHIMDKLGHDEVSDLTFVMGHRTGHVMRSRLAYLAERAHRLFHYQIGFRLLPGLFPYRPDWNFFLAPASKRLAWSFQRIDHTNELHGPLAWAQSLDEPMFHHRTAFTAALNYLSVLFPTAKIRLVGTDFNGHGYFFDEEMKRRGHQWSDFSTALQVARKGHFATIPDAVPERPGTVFDVFPFIRDSIRARGGTVVCSNPESGTITHGLAQYEPIVPINSNPNPRSVDAERAVLEMTRE